MVRGYVALVLNAHLPFVRQPDYPHFLEERWLFEAISETYLPLLRLMQRLDADGVPFRFSLVLSPTLTAMLSDELLKSRYVAYLDGRLELAAKEMERCATQPEYTRSVLLYEELYRRDREDFTVLYGQDILRAFDYFAKKGRIELMCSCATYAFLPNYRYYPMAVRAQVETAIMAHRERFGRGPAGFWLPHMGWYPGLEEQLGAYSIEYTVVANASVRLGKPAPRFGSYAPVACPNGLVCFPRDTASAEPLVSEARGYPSDPDYRDFYSDIGYTLPLDYLGAHIDDGRTRIPTGFKYWAVTGGEGPKRPYDPQLAKAKALEHAENFIYNRVRQARKALRYMERPPLMTASFDAELFGHWWLEGIDWLEALFRTAQVQSELRFLSLSDYLGLHPENQVSTPEFSSWGDGGYAGIWLDRSNDWIYRHAFKVHERMVELAERFPNESGLRERILNQAARESLLCQCSDWPLLMRAGKSSSFARRQVEDAVTNFNRIYEMLSANTVGTEWVTRLEKRNNLFPKINYRMFRKKR